MCGGGCGGAHGLLLCALVFAAIVGQHHSSCLRLDTRSMRDLHDVDSMVANRQLRDAPASTASSGNVASDAVRPRNDTLRPTHAAESAAGRRAKRGVVQLYNMVNCATGCDPLLYKGYGCYCGFLGAGRPVDGIDRCCRMHDICYDVADCPMYLEYVVPYYWKCHRGRSLCAVDHMDLGASGSCAQRLCECDRLLSECLSRFPCPRRRAKCVSSPWRLLQNTLMFF